jgi:hypothetical protein
MVVAKRGTVYCQRFFVMPASLFKPTAIPKDKRQVVVVSPYARVPGIQDGGMQVQCALQIVQRLGRAAQAAQDETEVAMVRRQCEWVSRALCIVDRQGDLMVSPCVGR